MAPKAYDLDDEYQPGSAGRSFKDTPLIYNPDAGTWSISREGAVGPDYGLTGSRQMTTAMTPAEIQNRLGFEDPVTQQSRAPDWWGDVPDLPQSKRFEFKGDAPTGGPEFVKHTDDRQFPLEGMTPHIEANINTVGSGSYDPRFEDTEAGREPAEQDWFMHNLTKHMKLGGDPQKFEFGGSFPTIQEITQAEQSLLGETFETEDQAIKALRLRQTGKWGPKEEAAQHGWRRADPAYGTLSPEDVGAVQDPTTGRWRQKEAIPESQDKLAIAEVEKGELADLEQREAGRFEIATSVDEILKKASKGHIITDEEAKILTADTESKLAGQVPLDIPQRQEAPPRRPDVGEGLFIRGIDSKTMKSRTYDVLGSLNEPAAFALYDMQAASAAAPELARWGGISVTDFNRTVEQQMIDHPTWSREKAENAPHVKAGNAVDINMLTMGKESNQFQWMKANAYKFCYWWPAYPKEGGGLEYHHWEHDCAAAKKQAKEWGLDETLTGSGATTQDRYASGQLDKETNRLLTGRQLTPGEARLAKTAEEYGGLVDLESETVEGLRRPISEKGAMKFSREPGFGEKVKQADLMFPGAPGAEFEWPEKEQPAPEWTPRGYRIKDAPKWIQEGAKGKPLSLEEATMFSDQDDASLRKVAKEQGIDYDLLAQKQGGPGEKPWSSMLPDGHVFSPSLNKPVPINTSMTESDIEDLINGEKRAIAKLWPHDKFKQLDATQEFARQVRDVYAKEAGVFESEQKRLFEKRQQIDAANEGIRTEIADFKVKKAKAEAMSAQAVQQTHEDVAKAKEQKLAVMTRDIENLGKQLAQMEPDPFRIFGFTDDDGSFSFSKLAFTAIAIPTLIANAAATMISSQNRRGRTVPFMAWNILQTAMTNDMTAQRAAVENKMKEFNLKKTSYGYWLSYFGDAPLAAQKMHVDMVNAGVAKLKELEAKEKDPMIKHYIKETAAYGMQQYRKEHGKFLKQLATYADKYTDSQKKLITHEQQSKKRFLDTQFFVMSKMNEEAGKGKQMTDLPGSLQKTYIVAKGFMMSGKIEKIERLWKKHGHDGVGSSIRKLVAKMDPDLTFSQIIRMHPGVLETITTWSTEDQGHFKGLLELQHMQHTMAASISKQSGNVGNDNREEQSRAMWNIPITETYERGWAIIQRFRANAEMFSNLNFYFQPGFQLTKEDIVSRGGKTSEYQGSMAYNMLQRTIAQNPDDYDAHTAAIKAFNGDLSPKTEAPGVRYSSKESLYSKTPQQPGALGEDTRVTF